MKNTPKEWALIQRIRTRVQRQNDHTIVGLGDDAFVFKNFPGYSVICQDMMVEDIHFQLDYFSPADLGYKALAINLSDIAAMAARPHFAQVSLALPKKINESWLDEFYEGMTELADKTSCEVAGGDMCGSPDKLVIDVSLHGSCESPVTRKGAQPGDLLLSSGPLGLSHTGLLALQKKKTGYDQAKLKHQRPSPRLDKVAEILQHRSHVHALMDCSDGLINDALQLCPQYGGLHLFAENIPVHAETRQLGEELGIKTEEFFLWGGEDFELLMAIPPDAYDLFPDWHLLGQFTPSLGLFLSYSDRLVEIPEFKGWQHF